MYQKIISTALVISIAIFSLAMSQDTLAGSKKSKKSQFVKKLQN